jgi:hypothetical protein
MLSPRRAFVSLGESAWSAGQTKEATMSKASKSPGSQVEVKAVAGELQSLMAMTVSELRTKYQDVFGLVCHSRNKDYLRKKIAFRIQELAEGGLSENAKAKIEELAAQTPIRQWHSRKGKADGAAPVAAKTPASTVVVAKRDPRLPPVGSVLKKTFKGAEHEVKVLADDFEYLGKRYASLSKVASEIAGAHWNGFGFFASALKAATGAKP